MDQKQNLCVENKMKGETPLEALEKTRQSKGLDSLLPMTYAGRLDPMAEGVLLVLVGEECKNKEKYLGLDKEYEVEVLFGFETDTGDVLGKVTAVADTREGESQKSEVKTESQNFKVLNTELQKFKGKFVQEYPAYSSKTVNGEHLHTLANEGRLPNEMPTKEVEIYDIQILDERETDSETLLKEIKENISKVNGDFRQSEIIELWEANLQGSDSYKIIRIKVSCSSGTYMRTLAEKIGKALRVPALAYSIKRTRIGDYGL